MKIDINALPPAIQYKLMCATVVPRPIAFVTTYSEGSGDNAAPFSFFNVMGENPPVLVIGLENKRHNDELKDTTANIRDTGQFVVNLVDESLAQAMNICAIDFPKNISETEQAGLTLGESSVIRPKRVLEAPIAFECEKITFLQIAPARNIVVAKVVMMHVRDGLLDPETWRINLDKYHPIGRMFGRLYTRTRDHFEMATPQYHEWCEQKPSDGAKK